MTCLRAGWAGIPLRLIYGKRLQNPAPPGRMVRDLAPDRHPDPEVPPMRRTPLVVAGLAVLALAADPPSASTPFFDGKTTAGWEGLSEHWSVRDGAIVGTTAP